MLPIAEPSIAPTPEQLRALTHPIRITLLGLLRVNGSQTATELARRTGLSTGSTSYHLRMLAKYGFINKDERLSHGRRLFWSAKHLSTVVESEGAVHSGQDPHSSTGNDITEPATTQTVEDIAAYLQVVAANAARMMLDASQRWASLPANWRKASSLSDVELRINAKQAQHVVEHIETILLNAMHDHPLDAEHTGTGQIEDERVFSIQLHAFPLPDDLGMHQSGNAQHSPDDDSGIRS